MDARRNISGLDLTRVDYQRRIYAAMNHIASRIESDITLSELARVAAFSEFHFHRIFKAVAGENVAEFTRRLRMELAVNRLLAYPDKDVGDIASSCGFSSPQNFAKAFRKAYGHTPTELRRRGRPFHRDGAADGSPKADTPDDGRKHLPASVDIREMPEAMAASVRRIGIDAESCAGAFIDLLTWAREHGIAGAGPLLAMYWDNPDITPLDKCRFDCCLPITAEISPSDSVFLQGIGGGVWAFCRFETRADGFKASWESAFRWLVESGYECRPLPCCELYYNDAREHPEAAWVYDIAIPLTRLR